MTRDEVKNVLYEMAKLLSLKGEGVFRIRAYENAARRVGDLDVDLQELVDEERLTEIPDIGKSMAAHIQELMATGKMAAHEKLKGEFAPGFLEILGVPDLGPKKAALVHEILGVDGIDDLESACRAGRVRELKGFGKRSEEKILEGIARVRRRHGRILLGKARPIAAQLVSYLADCNEVEQVCEAGSVRRWSELVHDIDVIVASEDAGAVMDHFVALPQAQRVLGRGGTKCSILTDDGVQVDLRVVPTDTWATALHHFTGSKNHNVRLRGLAVEMGLKVSEWGLFEGDERLDIDSEEALYQRLGMSFIPPELREDRGEIEAALENEVPGIVALKDLLGLVVTDPGGRTATTQGLIDEARAQGLAWLMLTTPDAGFDTLRAEVDATRTDGIEVRTGLQVTVGKDGRLSSPERRRADAGFVVASLSEKESQSGADATDALVALASTARVDVLQHPTGRRLGQRDGRTAQWPRVFEAATASGIALGIDGDPLRLDLPAPLVRQARDASVRLVLCAPCRDTNDLQRMRYALSVARRGWARPADLVNCAQLR